MSNDKSDRNYGGCMTAIFFGVFIGSLSALGNSMRTSIIIGIIAAILFMIFDGSDI